MHKDLALPAGFAVPNNVMWYLGSRTGTYKGVITQANVWNYLVPEAALRAMARGGTTVQGCCGDARWENFLHVIPNDRITQIADVNIVLPGTF